MNAVTPSTCHTLASLLLLGLVFGSVGIAQSHSIELRPDDRGNAIVGIYAGHEVVVHRTGALVADLRIHALPGSPAAAATWSEFGPDLSPTAYAAVTLDAKRYTDPAPIAYDLLLRHGSFDPLRGEPPVAPNLDGRRTGSRLWIVQYRAQGLEPWRETLRALGAEIHLFLAHHANVVEMGPETAAVVADLPFVRWIGPFHPAYRLEEELGRALASGSLGAEPLIVNLLTTRRGLAGKTPVASRIVGLGGRLLTALDDSYFLTAAVPAFAIHELATMDEVQWIDRWSPPANDMDNARSFHGANYAQSVGGYSGQGVRVEVMDGGCDITHPDLQNRVVHTTNVTGDHGTCTSGIVLGSGAGNASATGVMPNAFLVVGYYSSFAGGSRYNHTAELQNDALAYQCVLQSNSWGSALTTAYNSTSQNMDLILFDFPRISILNSQSNAGTQSSRPEAWAKNIISVGGIRHFNTESKSDDAWSGGASIGPAADGRIKPDVASFYDSTLCTDIVGAAGYSSTNYYSSFGGTSGATPITAGHLGLLYQMWADGVFGNAAPAATVYEDRPQNTTMKALLINTATQWSFSGTSHDLTRTHQGWGHVDLRTAWDRRGEMYIVDETDVLPNLGSTIHPVSVNAGTPSLKATLVYRDPPGTTSSTRHRINDLTLRVTSPSGTIYFGNNGLAGGLWSTSGGTANVADTVENVFVQSPEAGTWQVEVIAAEVNQDSHVETPAVDADYALVVSGVSTTPLVPPAAPSGLAATATSSSAIALSWIDNATNESGFEIDRSLDGTNFAQVATAAGNATSWADIGLTASTTYWYRVRATNGAGDSPDSNVASATTSAATAVDLRATGQILGAGSVSGAYTNTHSSNGVYQSIKEILSTGPNPTRYSFLQHTWTFSVPAGTTKSLFVEAHHSANSEGDDFVFEYSTDNLNYTAALTVTKTVDNNTAQSAALPSGLAGTVYIRVRDLDRTAGRRSRDTIFVDDLFIRSL